MFFFKVIFLCNAYTSNDKVLACCVLERIAAVFQCNQTIQNREMTAAGKTFLLT